MYVRNLEVGRNIIILKKSSFFSIMGHEKMLWGLRRKK
jgi:hypothetical protein